MAILTLISKLLGFAREMVMAGFFGTSYIVDAYVMSTAIPGIIFTGIYASVATSYMPLLSERLEKGDAKAANLFTSHIINLFFIISVAASLLGLLFSDLIVDIFAGGFPDETAGLTSFFVKVTFSYIFFSSAAAILESYLQYNNIFLSPIIIGYTQNIIVIGVIILGSLFNYYFLPFGLLIAYVVRFILFEILSKKRGMHYSFSFQNKETIKIILPLAIPVFIGTSISQISVFVDKALASGLTEGSVAALNYASLLNGMIMTLSISIMTTIIYPRLTKAVSLEDHARFNDIAVTGFNLALMIALPFSLGAMLYSGQVVQIVYERGAFDPAATALTGSAYLYYSAGLLFMALNDMLIRIYYSLRNMKGPMIFGGISVIIDIILNLILVRFMAHNGLALATSIAALCNTVFLFCGLKYKYPEIKIVESKVKLVKIVTAAVISVGATYLVYAYTILPVSHIIIMRTVQLGLAVAAAAAIYLLILKAFKISELELMISVFKRKEI